MKKSKVNTHSPKSSLRMILLTFKRFFLRFVVVFWAGRSRCCGIIWKRTMTMKPTDTISQQSAFSFFGGGGGRKCWPAMVQSHPQPNHLHRSIQFNPLGSSHMLIAETGYRTVIAFLCLLTYEQGQREEGLRSEDNLGWGGGAGKPY